MQNNIGICLWFNGQAEPSANFYSKIFENTRIDKIVKQNESIFTVSFSINGLSILGLNAGPQFKPNPAISFFVLEKNEQVLQAIWSQLAEEGKILMPFKEYDFASKYGWVEDKFGVSWQLKQENVTEQTVIPAFMFCGEQQGKAEEAIVLYTSIFKQSNLDSIYFYDTAIQKEIDAKVVHARFQLNNTLFAAMDSRIKQNFNFTEGASIIVNCKNQEEIDYYWNSLTSNGGQESQCGWLKDKFGVSWQIVPSNLNILLGETSENTQKVMRVLLKMKKLIIAELENA